MANYFYDATDSVSLSPLELIDIALRADIRVKVENVIIELLDRDVPALLRPALRNFEKIKNSGHTVICSKLDMLGKNANDILKTVDKFREWKINIICLEISSTINLGGRDGAIFRKTLTAYATLLSNIQGVRIRNGQKIMRGKGVIPGRTLELSESNRQMLSLLLSHGETVVSVAKQLDITRSAVYREIKRSNIIRPKKFPGHVADGGDW